MEGSYVTVSEAETYFDGDPRAEKFLDEDMEWYLIRATRIIDSLPLQGRKRVATQPLQFPRAYEGGYFDQDIPQAVRDACCEEALATYLEQAAGGSSRAALQQEGVASYQIPGIISETFRLGAGASGRKGMKSADAYRLLRGYITGSVPVL